MMTKKVLSLILVGLTALCLTMPGSAFSAEKKLKVAFALLWTIDDQGWTTGHYNGIEYLREQMGDQIEIAYTEKVRAADAERVFRGYAEKGFDLIFGTTFEHMDALMRVAKEYPSIRFEHCSGYKTSPNMGNYFTRMYQGEYLAGYMAGLMGLKNVGTVATQPIPEPIRGINSFTIGLIKGLDEANVTYDIDKLNTVVWLKSWRDPIKETTLAETLAARKHDLIRQMADTPDSSKAACAAGVPAIGYGTDAAAAGADCALVSSLFNWGPYYVETVKAVMAGTWQLRQYWAGFEKQGIQLSPFANTVPGDIQAKVLTEMERLNKGEDHIFTGPLMGQDGTTLYAKGSSATDKDLLSMRVFIKGVKRKIPQ